MWEFSSFFCNNCCHFFSNVPASQFICLVCFVFNLKTKTNIFFLVTLYDVLLNKANLFFKEIIWTPEHNVFTCVWFSSGASESPNLLHMVQFYLGTVQWTIKNLCSLLFSVSHGSTARRFFLSSPVLLLLSRGSFHLRRTSCCQQEASTTKWRSSQEGGRDWAGPWLPPCHSWELGVSSPAGQRSRHDSQLHSHLKPNHRQNLIGRPFHECCSESLKCDFLTSCVYWSGSWTSCSRLQSRSAARLETRSVTRIRDQTELDWTGHSKPGLRLCPHTSLDLWEQTAAASRCRTASGSWVRGSGDVAMRSRSRQDHFGMVSG